MQLPTALLLPMLFLCPGKMKMQCFLFKNYENFEGDDNMALHQCRVPLRPCVIAQICRPLKPALACLSGAGKTGQPLVKE